MQIIEDRLRSLMSWVVVLILFFPSFQINALLVTHSVVNLEQHRFELNGFAA